MLVSFDGELYTGLLFTEFGQCFIYACFLLDVNYEQISFCDVVCFY
jgi:hypothetical protein